MLAVAVAWLAGALAALALPVPDTLAAVVPTWAADASRWALVCAGWPLVRPRSARFDAPGVSPIGRWVGAAALGALVALATLVGEHARRLPLERPGEDRVLAGRVVGVPIDHGAVTSFTLALEGPAAIDGADPPGGVGRLDVAPGTRVRLALRGDAAPPRAGERWRLTARLGALDGLANDAGFDRERWMLGARLHGRGTVRPAPAPVRLDGPRRLGAGALSALRERARDRLAALGTANAHLPVVEALALGLGADVDESVRALLRATGTAHLLAISGLHVGLVAAALAGLVALLLRAVARAAMRIGERGGGGAWVGVGVGDPAIPATLVAGIGAALYALVAGGSLPTRRALAMLGVVAAARLAHRRIGRADGLAAALVAVLILDPLAPLSAGFWLSFGAVGAILWLHAARRLPRSRVLAALRTHALLGIALLPAGAWFFAEASLAAPLANLAAVPLATLVIVPASLAAAALAGPAPALAEPALALAQGATGLLLAGLGALDAAVGGDGAPVSAGLPGPLALICTLTAIIAATWPGSRVLAGFVPLLLLPSALHLTHGRPVTALEVHVLDVGQGLAVLLLTPEATVLYDTGGRRGDATMLEAVVMPHLRAQGRRRPDLLVVSHPDSDHSAGLVDARHRFADLPVLAGDAAAAEAMLRAAVDGGTGREAGGGRGPAVRQCVAGEGLALGAMRLDVLGPAPHDAGSENDASCVLLVTVGAVRVLLPGDIEAGAEALLVDRLGGPQRGPVLELDLLVSPHHGSRTSSTRAFVDAFPARHVVHAAGFANRFGFPHEPVTMRYITTGARQHVTGVGGALVFRFDADGPLGPPEPRRRAHRLARLGVLHGLSGR